MKRLLNRGSSECNPDGVGWRVNSRWIRRMIVSALVFAIIAFLITGCPTPVGPSGDKAITAFSFASPPATGTIDENAKTIAVTVPCGTDVTALVATFTTTGSSVKVGPTAQVSGTTANDFSGPVIYTVAAADGSTICYIVTVSVGAWELVGTAGFSPGQALQISLAIDSTGIAYVAISDWENNIYGATVMKYDSGSWQTVGTRRFSGATPYIHSIALDSANNPYVALFDGTLWKYDSGSWQTVGAPFGGGSYYALAIDSTDTPYVVYQDIYPDYKATVKKYTNGLWQTVGTARFSVGGSMWFPDIAIDSNGIPYVAYSSVQSQASVMKYDSGSWQTVGTAGFSIGRADYDCLVIDSTGTPYVAYVETVFNGYKARVMKYSGGSWQTMGLDAGALACISIAVDPTDNTLYVASDGGNGCRAMVMKYTGSSWQTVGKAGFSAGQVMSISLAIDPTGIPYVAYQDIVNGWGATVMRFR